MPNALLYPFGERPAVDDVTCHLLMPWDRTGFGFSNSTEVRQAIQAYAANVTEYETVEVCLFVFMDEEVVAIHIFL